ncbi:MAG: hypothetical protein Q4G09_02440 [Clostridia bacterium]|nr:hypothetical protein [Clostridia bacterium]
MKKVIRNVLIVIYAIIAIFITICLLSYNEFRITEFGQTSLILIDNDKLSTEFNKGDLALVKKATKEEIKIGDKIFFYNTYEKEISVSIAEIIGKEEITETETTYTLEGDKALSSEYVIGLADNAKTVGFVGYVLGFLESKWGFLFLIVFPTLLAFLYEIVEIIIEIKKQSKGKKEE